jgi:hypothetical protein
MIISQCEKCVYLIPIFMDDPKNPKSDFKIVSWRCQPYPDIALDALGILIPHPKCLFQKGDR